MKAKIQPPKIIQRGLKQAWWRMPGEEKKIYLSFDDGPIPECTPWVLNELEKYKAQATFFCVGENVARHTDIYLQILAQGHSTGNHTYNHLHAYKTGRMQYYRNIIKAGQYIKSKLFRPPHGMLRPMQYATLQKHYQIVMWDVMPYDFDKNRSSMQVLQDACLHTRYGSIVVFHDSLKSANHLQYVLPRYLETFANQGFTFCALPMFP